MIFPEHTLVARKYSDSLHLYVHTFFGTEIKRLFIEGYNINPDEYKRFYALVNIYKSIIDPRINGFACFEYRTGENTYVPKGCYTEDIYSYIRTSMDSMFEPYDYGNVYEEVSILDPHMVFETEMQVFDLKDLTVTNIIKMIRLFKEGKAFIVCEYIHEDFKYMIIEPDDYIRMSYIMEFGFKRRKDYFYHKMDIYSDLEMFAWLRAFDFGMLLTYPANVEYVRAIKPHTLTEIERDTE